MRIDWPSENPSGACAARRCTGTVNLLPWCCNRYMNTPNLDWPSYRGYRFSATVISHCVWLYFRFSLSYRDVEEMMAERGVVVSYETIREWCQSSDSRTPNARAQGADALATVGI
jgi:hypothetical protein